MKYYKIKQVAEMLNCSVSFVYDLIAEGRLSAKRLGKGQGGLRISETALNDFLDSVSVDALDLKHITLR